MAIGSVPAAQSFELLADVANEATLDDKTKNQAQQYMNIYTRIEYVRFLGAAAASTDALAATDAITLITRSLANIQRYGSSATTSGPAATSTARTPASTSVAKIMNSFRPHFKR